MLWLGLIWIGLLVVLVVLFLTAPYGWEDETGFHYGRPEDLDNQVADSQIGGDKGTLDQTPTCPAHEKPISLKAKV